MIMPKVFHQGYINILVGCDGDRYKAKLNELCRIDPFELNFKGWNERHLNFS